MNPDLFDIGKNYADGCFLVGEQNARLVATGAYRPEQGELATARMQRMSVAKSDRANGYGGQMLNALEQHARAAGYVSSVLETNDTWTDAVRFYRRHGYQQEFILDGEIHFRKSLESNSQDS